MSGQAHFFVSVVTLACLGFILHSVRRRKLAAKYSILWLSVGLVVAILAVSPKSLDRVSVWVGVAYPPTILFILSTAFFFLIAVHFSWELSRLEERTRLLAEEMALMRAEMETEIDLSRPRNPTTEPETRQSAGVDLGLVRDHDLGG